MASSPLSVPNLALVPVAELHYAENEAKRAFPIVFPFPVHEVITMKALKGVLAKTPENLVSEKEGFPFHQGLLAGVVFNDMPGGLAEFASEFVKPKLVLWLFSTVGIVPPPEVLAELHGHNHDTMTCHSHFGKLQYWHSMAPPGAKSAEEIKEKITGQAREWYDLACSEKTKGDWYKAGNLVGRVLHMVQDSWSTAHVEREGKGPSMDNRTIKGFQDYSKQDSDKHTEEEQPKNTTWDSMCKIEGVIEAEITSERLIAAFLLRDRDEFMRLIDANYPITKQTYFDKASKSTKATGMIYHPQGNYANTV